jgi:putative membrane protein
VRAPWTSVILQPVDSPVSGQDSSESLPRTDQLAIDRTLLANERTFLAYFRTAVVFLTSGLAVMNIEFFAAIRQLSFLLIGLSPLVFLGGAWRFWVVRRSIRSHYHP